MKNDRLGMNDKMLEYGILKPYPNIFGFSTTRHGGCGEGAYATFNCTHYCGDRPENVKANLDILASSLPERPRIFVIPRQTHTTNVRVITDVPTAEELQDVDAVVTHLKDFCLCVSTADCVPILIYDKAKQVIAAVHAGWRGTVAGIVSLTLRQMKTLYGTEGKDVHAAIGPGISLDAFEVGDEVYETFYSAGFPMDQIAVRREKWHIDLWAANRLQLLDEGLRPDAIEMSGICTWLQVDRFFSARRLGVNSGRILTGIMQVNK